MLTVVSSGPTRKVFSDGAGSHFLVSVACDTKRAEIFHCDAKGRLGGDPISVGARSSFPALKEVAGVECDIDALSNGCTALHAWFDCNLDCA